MVIHDLRNPSESIHEGLKQAKMMMNEKIDTIFIETEKVFKNYYQLSSIDGDQNTTSNLRDIINQNINNYSINNFSGKGEQFNLVVNN